MEKEKTPTIIDLLSQ